MIRHRTAVGLALGTVVGLLAAALAWIARATSGPPARPTTAQPSPKPLPEVVARPPVPLEPPGRRRGAGALYWLAVVVLGALGLVGVGALVALARAEPAPGPAWGVPAAAVALLLSTGQAAPTLAFATRLARGYWGAPARRAAELGGLSGLVAAPLGLVVLAHLPPFRGRPGIWLDWPGAPALPDGLALLLLAACGLALAWTAALPDLAADGRRFALGWRGTPRQWRALDRALVALGGLYAMLFVFANLLVASDLAMSLVPGWHSANLPPYHAVSAFEGGLAVTALALWLLRGRYPTAVGVDTFHALGKLVLALALLFFYFSWAELLTYWYGRTVEERDLLERLMFGARLPLFLVALAGCFLAPLLVLMWNRWRASAGGVALASLAVLVGLVADRVRLYDTAWSALGPGVVPPLAFLVLVGLTAGAGCACLLAVRLVPAVPRWEVRQRALLTVEDLPYLLTSAPLVAKPS